MAVTDFIAAIELGSTNITGIAGKRMLMVVSRFLPMPMPLRQIASRKVQSLTWIKLHKFWFLSSRNWKKTCRLPSKKSM